MLTTRPLKVRALALAAALLLLLLLVPLPAAARPSDWRAGESHECQLKEDTEALCQRCAKWTKSPMVYPMCCRDEEEVRAWCHRYLTYGLQ